VKKLITVSTIGIALSAIFLCGCQSAYMTSAKIYVQQKEYNQAIGSLKQEVASTPTNGEAYFLMGQLYGEMDSLLEMVSAFENAEKINPAFAKDIKEWRSSKSAEVFNKGIDALKKKKDLNAAIKWTLLSTRIDPKNINAMKNLGFFYQEKAKSVDSTKFADSVAIYKAKRIATYEEAFKIAPTDTEVVPLLAGLYIDDNKPDKALEMLTPLLESAKLTRYYLVAADAYDSKKDKPKALDMLKKAESLDDKNATLLFEIGMRAFEAEQYEAAGQYFQKVTVVAPDNIDAYNNEAISYINATKFPEAEKAILDLIKKNRTNSKNWGLLSDVWVKLNKAKDAKSADEVRKALEANDNIKAEQLIKAMNVPGL
jgi:tetratricopeptide (TPR) repeat protein